MPEKNIEQVQKDHSEKWMAIQGVEGTAIGLIKDKPCIMVFTSTTTGELSTKIPSTVEGYPVIIKQTGKFHALGDQ